MRRAGPRGACETRPFRAGTCTFTCMHRRGQRLGKWKHKRCSARWCHEGVLAVKRGQRLLAQAVLQTRRLLQVGQQRAADVRQHLAHHVHRYLALCEQVCAQQAVEVLGARGQRRGGDAATHSPAAQLCCRCAPARIGLVPVPYPAYLKTTGLIIGFEKITGLFL